MTTRRRAGRRRGAVLVEAAIVYPALLFLLLGAFVVGLGVFRRNQLSHLAYESARWAAVRSGPNYQTASGGAAVTNADVQTFVRSKLVGMTPSAVTCDALTTTPNNQITVTLRYTWGPEMFLSPMQFVSTAAAPITY